MADHNMEYNSEKGPLIISEYGRNIQLLIAECKKVEDEKKRQAMAERIVHLMHQMNPTNRNLLEYEDKLWRHFFRIANYDIDVKAPFEIIEEVEKSKKPDTLGYPPTSSKFRHYGQNVQKMVDKALKMEDLEKRQGFAEVIGSYMKMAYKTWNREHYVSDEIIVEDLQSMSQGQLKFSEGVTFDTLHQSAQKRSKRRDSNHRDRDNGQRGRRRNNNKYKRRR